MTLKMNHQDHTSSQSSSQPLRLKVKNQNQRPEHTEDLDLGRDVKREEIKTEEKPLTSPPIKPAPGKEKEWFDFFRLRFGPYILLILWITTGNVDIATFYAPNPEECNEMAPHLARLLAKFESAFRVPSWVHTSFITSDSSLGFLTAFAGYLDRIGVIEKIAPYFRSNIQKVNRGINNNGKATNNAGPIQGRNTPGADLGVGVYYSPVGPGSYSD